MGGEAQLGLSSGESGHSSELPSGDVPLTIVIPEEFASRIPEKDRTAVLERARQAAEEEVLTILSLGVLDTLFGEIASNVPDAIDALGAQGIVERFIPINIMNALASLYVDNRLDKNVRLDAIQSGAGGWIRTRMVYSNLIYFGLPEARINAIQSYIDQCPDELRNYSAVVFQAINDLVRIYNLYVLELGVSFVPSHDISKEIVISGRQITKTAFIDLMDKLSRLVALATLPEEERRKLSFASDELPTIPLPNVGA